MRRIVGSAPLFVDCDPYGKTVSWSASERGPWEVLPVVAAALVAMALRHLDVEHDSVLVDGGVSIAMDSATGEVTWSKLDSPRVYSCDAVQLENFLNAFDDGVQVASTGIGAL